MTSKYLVILLGCVVVLVWNSAVTAEECPEGDANCSLTTQYNNELEPTTQEVVTHTAKPIETTKVMETNETTENARTEENTTQELTTPEVTTPETVTKPPINVSTEDLTDNDIAPSAIPSVIPLGSTESSSTVATVVEMRKDIIGPKDKIETTSIASKEELETTSLASKEMPETTPVALKEKLETTSVSSNKTSETTSVASPRTEEPAAITETSSFSIVTDEHKEPMMTDMITTVSPMVDEMKTKTEASSTISTASDETTEAREMSTVVGVTEEAKEEMKTTTEEEHDEMTETTMAATTLGAVVIEPKHMQDIITVLGSSEEPKGRSLNFTLDEEDPNNIIASNYSSKSHHNDFDLSDVTINDNDDEDDFDFGMEKSKILAPKFQEHNSTYGICEKGGLTYENGEKLEIDCDSVCTCRNGKMDCTDRCVQPFFKKGLKKTEDPLCHAKDDDDDHCCSVLVCTGDTETEPLEICLYENKTYNRGDHFNKNCSEVCTCEAAGKITCKPRCLPVTKTSDRCVELPDPIDSCCTKVLCDVTLEEHDSEKEYEKPKQKILSAKYINTTAIHLTFDSKFDDNESLPDVEVSNDRSNWTYYRLLPGGLVFVKDNVKYLKLENTEDIIDVQDTELGPFPSIEVNDDIFKDCEYKGKTFKIGEEYNDNCESLCICLNGQMKCLKIQCPTYFGVDVLDANCIEWETVPKNFVPSAPNCCPEKVKCKDNGSCDYKGRMYRNWEELPSNVTGCDQRCYCEMGKVECQNACPPVTALPPPTLPCPPHLAMVGFSPGETCCKEWMCNTESTSPENKRNQTNSDSKGHIHKTTTDTHEAPFVPKVPSKTLGPLAVYANEDKDHNIAKNSLGAIYKPILSDPYENPYFRNYPRPPKPNPTKTTLSTYYTPIAESGKPTKDTQHKVPNKNASLFITPPPRLEPAQDPHENYIPNEIKPQTLPTQPTPAHSEINIHTHSNPEELLQFINQHPEISNYPSGSVLEFHNLPPNFDHEPSFINAGMPTTERPKIHLVPYVVPQDSEGHHVMDNLPPGLSLEEILTEFHKGTQSFQNNPSSFFPHLQNAGSNGPLLVTRPNGPVIPNRLNTTHFTDTHSDMFPGNFPNFPNQPHQDEIIIQSLDAVDPHKVRLSFTVPQVLVGLHGRVEVRYTHDKADDDIDSWMLAVFAPPNDLIATSSLAFDLTDLKADTEYKIKVTVTLQDLQNTSTSKVYKITTPKEVHPPVIPINPDLAITDINATWVTVVWRPFTQYELSFIDGLQLRYKEIDGRLFTATPLIHRAETTYTLEKLKPNTKYEIGIYFIPFPNQMTELRSENILHFTTANEIDTYGFNVTLDISQIKSQSVEITWNGVPYPEDKYVNIYRVIYQSDSGKEDQSTFKIAKRDSPTKTLIKELKPGTRYRIWLEVYLTNGKIKTSNVEDFITKPRVAPAIGASTQQDKLSRAEVIESKGDYYGPLVIVAILAAIAILSTLILLLILVRRHNQNKAAITPPSTRISQSAYDNPTYKVEIQQETMGL